MSLIKRTREFNPGDNSNALTELEIDARIEEIGAKRAAMDPEKHFTGLKRLGRSCTAAEALAFIDGTTSGQTAYGRSLFQVGMVFAGFASSVLSSTLTHRTYMTGLAGGLLLAPPMWFIANKAHDWKRAYDIKREKIYIHYALMHERELPRLERKTFGEIMYPWPAHRSLNLLRSEERPKPKIDYDRLGHI